MHAHVCNCVRAVVSLLLAWPCRRIGLVCLVACPSLPTLVERQACLMQLGSTLVINACHAMMGLLQYSMLAGRSYQLMLVDISLSCINWHLLCAEHCHWLAMSQSSGAYQYAL